ncbi:MAG: pentapeptide repeat-containing protein, partial [Actinomycetota bacterium]|nr:pentapeptide repeat-containing protein [Actinomycetota bacterium]
PDTETNKQNDSPREPSADIQAILDVLGRRKEDRVPEEFRVRPDLRRTDLRRANLTGNLIGANFFRANLAGAFLIQANLVQANFFRADLTGADLFRADLANADLERADLTGVRDLTQEQLEQAIGDATTKLPEGFTRPASWTTGTDEQADGDE